MDEAAPRKDWQCRSDDHDYQQLGRAVIKDESVDGLTHQLTMEPIRLFCRKCGWVRDIPA
jgi:hypothetical protein